MFLRLRMKQAREEFIIMRRARQVSVENVHTHEEQSVDTRLYVGMNYICFVKNDSSTTIYAFLQF